MNLRENYFVKLVKYESPYPGTPIPEDVKIKALRFMNDFAVSKNMWFEFLWGGNEELHKKVFGENEKDRRRLSPEAVDFKNKSGSEIAPITLLREIESNSIRKAHSN